MLLGENCLELLNLESYFSLEFFQYQTKMPRTVIFTYSLDQFNVAYCIKTSSTYMSFQPFRKTKLTSLVCVEKLKVDYVKKYV